jgi:hypothetical protein
MRPSEFEVNAGAQRILAEMRSRKLRRHRLSKPWIAAGVLLVGALAYAATETRRFESSSGSETSSSREGGSVGVSETGSGQVPPRPPQPTERRPAGVELEGDGGSPAALPRETPVATPGPVSIPHAARKKARSQPHPREARGAPAPRATWSEVAQALDAGDPARAERALENLLTSQAGSERAKARLGLSQLALGQADCISAIEHARRVLADSNGGHLHIRARSIVTECATHTLPPRPPFKD